MDAIRTYVGRVFTALALLFLPGDRTPVTRRELQRLEAEWTEWHTTFVGLLEKLNAWHARQAKREKRALERSLAEEPDQLVVEEPDRREHKRALSRRVAAGILADPSGFTAPAAPNHTPEDEP